MISEKAEAMLKECLDLYLELLDKAEDCDPEAKKEKTKEYVDRLLSEGGAAVDSMNKIIGKEKTAKLVREFMYGL